MKLQVKIILLVMFVSVLMASVIGVLSKRALEAAMYDRLEKEGEFIADSLKDKVDVALREGDMNAIYLGINNVVRHNDHVKYIIVQGKDKNVVSHTFEDELPSYLVSWLAKVDSHIDFTSYFPEEGETIRIAKVNLLTDTPRIYIGMDSKDIETYVIQLRQYLVAATIGVVVSVMFIAVFLSRRIVAPLESVTRKIEDFGRGVEISFEEVAHDWSEDLEVKNLLTTFRGMVAERELSIHKLRRSEQSLAKAQKIAGLGNWDWDIENNTLEWSEGIYILFGLNSADFEATYEAFLASVHIEDRGKVESAVAASLQDSKVPYNIDHRIVLPSGGIRYVNEQAEIVRHKDGTPLRMVGTVLDITERKNIEQELVKYRDHLEDLVDKRTRTLKHQALIINQIHDAVVLADIKGTITFWNKGAERIFNYSRNSVIGQQFTLLFPNKNSSEFEKTVIALLKKNGTHEMDCLVRRSDQSTLDAHVSLSLIEHELGGRETIAAYFVDITDRKEAERSLLRRSNELAAVNKELESFSYSVSHDLRAPLRAIDGFSVALLEDYSELLDDTGKDYLRRVRSGAQRMASLIDDLLKLSRMTREELHFVEVNMSELASEIMMNLMASDPERSVDVAIAPGITANADKALLHVVLENLLGNAWKFTSATQYAFIEFGANEIGGELTYFIHDNGAGFDMKYGNKLFGAFQRLHHADQFEGTGIGLATVQRVINRHGGRIWAKGEVDKGAVFNFTLASNDVASFPKHATYNGLPTSAKLNESHGEVKHA